MAAELQQRLHHAACVPEFDFAPITTADQNVLSLRVELHIPGGHHMCSFIHKATPAQKKIRNSEV